MKVKHNIISNLVLILFAVMSLQAVFGQVQIEEIIVTAEKREQSLQDVPVAVTAFSETYINEARIDGTTDLVGHIPNFHLAPFTRVQALPTLRGAQSGEDGPGLDQPVAMFVDDVYKGRVTDWDLALFDVERIEVLRGPQGTLFGRNVVGGLINVVTKKPTEETRIVLEAGSGRFDLIDVKGVISGPLLEDSGIYGSIAFSSKTRDGFTFNQATGKHVDSVDKQSGKAQLRFVPNDEFEVLLQADLMRDTGFGQHRDYVGPAPTSAEFGGFMPDDDPDTTNQPNDGGVDRTSWGTSMVVDWDMGFAQIKSISAYYEDEATLPATDVFGSPLPDLLVETQEFDLEQFTQEIRISGDNAIQGRLNWVVGMYYLYIDHTRDRNFVTDFAEGTIIGDLFPGAAEPDFLETTLNNETDSISGFFQGTFSILDNLRLTVGGRYTHDKKDGVVSHAGTSFIFTTGAPFSLPVSESWSKYTSRVTLDFDLTEDIMVYATYSEGFKSGGFIQFGLPTAEAHTVPLNPESAKNYEIGVRSSWFKNRVTANITAYMVDYTDLQVSQLVGTTFLQTNAGKAEAEGVDVELNAAITEGLTAWINYNYFDGEYTSDELFPGNEMVSPPHAFSTGMAYRQQLGDKGALRMRLDVQHKDEYFQDPANEPGIVNGLDSIVNASITWELKSNWAFTLWGKNLTDERAYNYLNDSTPFMLSLPQAIAGQSTLAANYIPPLTWGVSARYTFE